MGEGILIYGIKAGMGKAAEKIARVLSDIRRQGFSSVSPFSVGAVEKRMKEYAKTHGITLGSEQIYMSSHSIAHTMRDTKVKTGMAISASDLMSFPKSRRKMELFYDGSGFVYTNRKTKYIIHPNYKIKTNSGKVKRVMFVTAGVVRNPNEFNLPKYKKI
jgi:hypothetical protein